MASGSVALLTEAVHAAFAALARARIGTWDCPTREGPLSVLLPPDLRDGCGAATNQDDWSPLGDQRGAILFLSSSWLLTEGLLSPPIVSAWATCAPTAQRPD